MYSILTLRKLPMWEQEETLSGSTPSQGRVKDFSVLLSHSLCINHQCLLRLMCKRHKNVCFIKPQHDMAYWFNALHSNPEKVANVGSSKDTLWFNPLSTQEEGLLQFFQVTAYTEVISASYPTCTQNAFRSSTN